MQIVTNRNVIKQCLFCGKEFEPKNPKGVYCSDKCRVYANRGYKPKLPEDQVTLDNHWNSEVDRQIQIVEREKIPPERNTPLGRKTWEIEQRQKIEALRSLFK